MNFNLLITENNFVGATSKSPVPSKPDEIREGAKFSLTPYDEHPQVNSFEKPTTYNVNDEIQNREESISKSPQEFTKSIRKRTKSENPSDPDNKTKSKEQNADSGTIEQPNEQQNLNNSGLAEQYVAVKQGKEGPATTIESKTGQQLAQIIANTQTGKSPSVTGHAVKSAEIKLLHTTEKGQLGLKTVLPTTSEGQNGLKAVLPGTSNSIPEGKKQPETKSITEKGSIKELMPEVPANTGKSTTTAGGKTSAVNINLQAVQAKTPQMQPQPAGIDPEKPVSAKENDAKTTDSQTLSQLLNPNGKETTHTGNNLSENHAAQKLNIAAVQVSTGQAKDQGTSTSNKNNSQGFEQMLSHNTPQILITEQTPAAAKNATTANMPDQNSSSNVSADIGKQILESIHNSISQQGAERQITVRLNPPELGKVSITFRQQDAELTGLMEVSKAQTRYEIEQTLPQIIRNLADSGIQIKRLEVMLSNEEQSGHGTLGNQSLQSGGTHQQNSANHGMPGYNPDADESNEWLASNNSYENPYEFQEGFITDGSINMLI